MAHRGPEARLEGGARGSRHGYPAWASMGLTVTIQPTRPLDQALAALATAGFTCQVLAVDGQLVHPTAPVPASWREVRVRTPAGMITLRQQGGEVALIVFGNADAALLAARDRLAAALQNS